MFDPSRIGGQHFDWDLVTCINELRSYVYGGLRESQLTAFIDNNIRISRFKGLMSFYPLVTHVEQLAMLDGWLIGALRRATRERRRIQEELRRPLRARG
jgi:RNA-directed DNA polymerase